MRYLLIILLVMGISPVRGQISLNLETCREMALESSKKMSIATKQGEKAEFERKAYRANFCRSFRLPGYMLICRKRVRSRLTGDICQRSYRVPTGSWFIIYILIRQRNFR